MKSKIKTHPVDDARHFHLTGEDISMDNYIGAGGREQSLEMVKKFDKSRVLGVKKSPLLQHAISPGGIYTRVSPEETSFVPWEAVKRHSGDDEEPHRRDIAVDILLNK